VSKPTRAVLRNVKGEHLTTLSLDEIEMYEHLAEQGKVHRAQKMKKGRLILIFRLTEVPQPEVAPSFSQDSSCSLTDADSFGLAARHSAEQSTPRRLLERWIGWGLLYA
jgi:hypothetical protein